ncbi:hypothetical protein [Lysobacter sp. CA199]|uniref:hypothetical protein n=1 Tax=Lysobacter sp. CA199 TaxID=3455608 RepID=UPI003F8D094F
MPELVAISTRRFCDRRASPAVSFASPPGSPDVSRKSASLDIIPSQEKSVIVRISKGTYPAGIHAEVTARMNAASQSLVPAIRRLPGCLGFYVATEESSSTMVNVSIWDALEQAQAMSTLAEMSALAQEFTALGVQFERPIINYPVLWTLA